jgi:hypothetical protein
VPDSTSSHLVNSIVSKTKELDSPIKRPGSAPSTTLSVNIADTGSNGHFFPINAPLVNVQLAINSIPVTLPGGSIIYSSLTAELDFPDLPLAARAAHIFPNLTSGSLLSVGQLCNAGCIASFDTHVDTIAHNNRTIITGTHSPHTRLWHLSLLPPSKHRLLFKFNTHRQLT